MGDKRILTIQDVSCVGQCSMTVAMPILSAWGHETCILPTALLSTHTGGFGTPKVVHFDGALPEIVAHWQRCGMDFDAILVGYLGSVAAVELAGQVLQTMLAPGGVRIVDPVMGDHGKLYSGFDDAYVQAMKQLCTQADILLPNGTEAALLTDQPYVPELSLSQARTLAEQLPADAVILTGIGSGPDKTGVLLRQGDAFRHVDQPRLPGSYHGTGDIYAACFTGAYAQGRTLEQAAAMAAEFTGRCIQATLEAPAHWYGTRFESQLDWIIRRREEASKEHI